MGRYAGLGLSSLSSQLSESESDDGDHDDVSPKGCEEWVHCLGECGNWGTGSHRGMNTHVEGEHCSLTGSFLHQCGEVIKVG